MHKPKKPCCAGGGPRPTKPKNSKPKNSGGRPKGKPKVY